jgi:hypothetical protein
MIWLDYLNYLFYCFVQVTEDDPLPKIMCGECSYKLDLLSDFKERAYKTETQLLSKVNEIKGKTKVDYRYLIFSCLN